MLSIAVTYFITLCLFPGLESEIRHCILGEWLPILIMAVFNLSDFVGKVGARPASGGGCPWGGSPGRHGPQAEGASGSRWGGGGRPDGDRRALGGFAVPEAGPRSHPGALLSLVKGSQHRCGHMKSPELGGAAGTLRNAGLSLLLSTRLQGSERESHLPGLPQLKGLNEWVQLLPLPRTSLWALAASFLK